MAALGAVLAAVMLESKPGEPAVEQVAPGAEPELEAA
jgi:hypothetical protein